MIEYEINAAFAKDVEIILADKSLVEFNPLRDQDVKILTEICTRTTAEGEEQEPKGAPVTCKRIPAPYSLLTHGDYLIVADNYFWTHATDLQKNAALHHALSIICIERNKKGKILLKTRKPDVQEFRATMARYGSWNEPLQDAEEALKSAAKRFALNNKPKA